MKNETPERLGILREYFSFDPETGVIVWIQAPRWHSKVLGAAAGFAAANGYIRIRLGRISHQAHRVGWALHFDQWPAKTLDHINGDTKDNRICNLRECTAWQNQGNASVRIDNKTGYTGVYPVGGRFQAQIRIKGKIIYLGRFDTAEMASEAYKRAAALHRGAFARQTNRKG